MKKNDETPVSSSYPKSYIESMENVDGHSQGKKILLFYTNIWKEEKKMTFLLFLIDI